MQGHPPVSNTHHVARFMECVFFTLTAQSVSMPMPRPSETSPVFPNYKTELHIGGNSKVI